jgi:hypothetical protein
LLYRLNIAVLYPTPDIQRRKKWNLSKSLIQQLAGFLMLAPLAARSCINTLRHHFGIIAPVTQENIFLRRSRNGRRKTLDRRKGCRAPVAQLVAQG